MTELFMIAVPLFKELQDKTLFLLKTHVHVISMGEEKCIELFMGKQTLGFSAYLSKLLYSQTHINVKIFKKQKSFDLQCHQHHIHIQFIHFGICQGENICKL